MSDVDPGGSPVADGRGKVQEQPPTHTRDATGDTLTELRALHGRLLAKRIRLSQGHGKLDVLAYDKAHEFSVRQHRVTCLSELHAVLETLKSARHSCVVLDRLLDPSTAERTRRNKQAFEPVAHRYVPIDLDGIKPPPGLDWRVEPEAAVLYAISTLLPAFQGTSCIWQFTASHGIKPGLRLRLWFWLDRPTGRDEIKIWLCEPTPVPGVPKKSWLRATQADPNLYHSVQIIYTASPVFEGGAVDPVPHRSGFIAGEREMVSVPVPIEPRYAALARPQRRALNATPIAIESVTQPYERGGAGFEYHVSTIGDGPGQLGFYGPMLAATAAWISQHGPDADASNMLACLITAVRSALRDPAKHTLDYIEEKTSNLPALVEWVRDQEHAKRAERARVGQSCEAPCALPALSLGQAGAALERAMEGAFAESLKAIADRRALRAACSPATLEVILSAPWFFDVPKMPCIGIGAGIGLGKTEKALRALLVAVRADSSLRIAYAVPTHETADDVATRLNCMAGATISRVWRGTGRPDPGRPGRLNCPMHALVEQIQHVGGRIADACGGPERGWCAHNPRRPGISGEEACAYRQQFASDVQVWIVPHAMLTHRAPRPFHTAERERQGSPFDMLVLDEAPWLGLFGGRDRQSASVTVSELNALALKLAASEKRDVYRRIVDKMSAALTGQSGLLKRAPFMSCDLSVAEADHAARLTQGLRQSIAVNHDLASEAAAITVRETYEKNRSVILAARFWSLLAAFLRSGEAIAPWSLSVDEDAAGERTVLLRWKEELNGDWAAGPVLYLDATVIPEVASAWLPNLRIEAAVRARETHVHRVAVIDRVFGRSSLLTAECGGDAAEAKRQTNTIGQIVRFIERIAFRFRGQGARPGPDVAVVTYKDLEPRLRGQLPANVALGHFNALRGFDGWRGVAAIVVLGRPEASPRDVEIMASLATNRLVPPNAGYYPRGDGVQLMRDGTGRRVTAHIHPDPKAEAFRRQIATELEQIEGRARPVRRGPGARLFSVMLTSTPTALALDATVAAGDLLDAGGIIDALFARGIVPETARDAGRVLADVFVNGDPAAAVRQRLHREGEIGALTGLFSGAAAWGKGSDRKCDRSIRDLNRAASHFQAQSVEGRWFEAPLAGLESFRCFRYRLPRERRSGRVLIDIDRYPDPRQSLTDSLGPLEHFVSEKDPVGLADVRAALAGRGPHAPASETLPIVLALPVGRTPFHELLCISDRTAERHSPVPPAADDIYRVESLSLTLRVHERHSTQPLYHRVRDGAFWPPQRTPIIAPPPQAAEPRMSAVELAIELGAKPRSLMVGPSFAKLQRDHGKEQALVIKLIGRFGRDAVLAAASCFLNLRSEAK
ncbi:hypothetical protein [Methylobacterium sp. SI9]|uniref:hypothetical protein n=1 Tax=Methylobacterium guangdongense TaxID=3138811 RepID=UPI00313DC599